MPHVAEQRVVCESGGGVFGRARVVLAGIARVAGFLEVLGGGAEKVVRAGAAQACQPLRSACMTLAAHALEHGLIGHVVK